MNLELESKKGKKLWNPKVFPIISVFFSFLPASILYLINLGRIGLKKKRNKRIIEIVIIYIIVIFITLKIDSRIARSIMYGINIGIGWAMRKEQEAAFKRHIENGGEKASYLLIIIICVIVFALLLYTSIKTINLPDEILKVGDDEVYYTENVDIEEVKELAKYLEESGFFPDDRPISIKIDKDNEKYLFYLIVKNKDLTDDLIETFNEFGDLLSVEVFDQKKVEIVACDRYFNPNE